MPERAWPVFRSQRRVERTGTGEFRLRLPESERRVLRGLPDQLRAVIDGNDPAAFRLFPPAYADDPEANAEYDRLVRDDLLAERLDAVRVVEETVEADRLTEEQLGAWLSVLNDARLVLGTRLQVTEETYERTVPRTDPRAPALAMYFYLGWLEEQLVEALAGGDDPPPAPGVP
jgi:hypothetical protein